MATIIDHALEAARIEDADQYVRGEFLQIARHGEQDGRRNLEQRRREVFRVLAEMRHEARDQRQGHGDIPPKDMTGRQVDHRPVLSCGERRIVCDEVGGRGEMLAVGDEGALGVPGRARRVDDEGRLVRPHALGDRPERREIGGLLSRQEFAPAADLGVRVAEHGGVVDDHDEAQVRQPVREGQDLVDVFLILGDEDRGAAVAHLVLDFRCRGGGIDAVDDGAERLRGEIGDHPLLCRIAHDGDALARRHAEAREGARRVTDERSEVGPGALAIEPEMLGAEGHGIRRRLRALAQQKRRGLAAQRLVVDRCGCRHGGPWRLSSLVGFIDQQTGKFYRSIKFQPVCRPERKRAAFFTLPFQGRVGACRGLRAPSESHRPSAGRTRC